MGRLFVVLATGLGALALAACGDAPGGSGGGEPAGGGVSGPGSLMGSIQGLESGGGVAGGTVTVDGAAIEVNEQGWFFLSDVAAKDRVVVEISAPGYVTTQRVVTIRPGRNSFLDAKLFSRALPQDVDAAAGGEVISNNGAVTLPPNAFRAAGGGAFSGNAAVSLTILDPSSREQRLAVPGDFSGTPLAGGDPVRLATFGMVDLSAEDADGNPLELDPGAATQLRIPVPSALTAAPPATIPLWRFDPLEARWIETGVATYDAPSSCYEAPVDRPASWNADQPYATACVKGQIVDPAGRPAIGGISVTSEGVSYLGDGYATTLEEGFFTVEVMASTDGATQSAQLYAQGGGLYTADATPIPATPTALTSSGECLDIGTITLAYPLARAVLTWGELPSDLDSHLTGPDGEGARFHMFYGNSDIAGLANLDTDDTSSFGPEVTSLLRAEPGSYVYAIHNYSGEGSGPIKASGAKITALFPGEVRTFSVADAAGDATGNGVWRVFGFEIDADGTVQNLQTLNQIVEDGETAYEP